MEADLNAFFQGCLVCIISASGYKSRRPLGSKVHTEIISEFIHFDFLYIGESTDEKEFILILKDDLSGYVFHRSCKCTDTESTAEVLIYFTTFVFVLNLFFDQGSHFKNLVMELLAHALGAKHNFITPYVPWSNGTVEEIFKHVLRVMNALMFEFQLPEAEWTTSFLAIQSIINNASSRRLNYKAPITVRTGMESGNPLNLALKSIN